MQILDPDKTRKIKQILRANPRGLTITDLSARMKMNRNLMAKYLDILSFSGHVEMRVTGTAKVYFISNRVPVSAMLEYSSEYIILLDAELRIIQANTRFLSLIGMDRDRLIGTRIGEADHPFLREVPVRELPPSLEQFESHPVEIPVTIDDRRYYFRMKMVPISFEDGKYGQTLIFEDITEQRAAEEKIRTYLEQQEFFSRKLLEFAELPPDADLYSVIGAGFCELLPDAIIDVNAYNSRMRTLGLMAIFGDRSDEFVRRVRENNVCWEASRVFECVPEILRSGKLYPIPGGIQYASFGQVSAEAGEQIENEFNIGDLYSIGLMWRGNLLGNILILLRKGSTISNAPLIELYARAASIALQRHLAERAVNNPLIRTISSEDT